VARILWRDAQGIEGSLDLGTTEIKIGRAMDCAIRTDDAMVSRHHSRVFWGGGGFVLEDLGSANGVYFQEQRVQSHLFKHGDAVRCGSLWLRFVDTNQLGAGGGGGGPAGNQPMMQHPGMGAVGSTGTTGHVAVVQPGVQSGAGQGAQGSGAGGPYGNLAEGGPVFTRENDHEVEIRVLRRRIEQLQTELRVFRSNKFNQDAASKMEDLENDLSMAQIERDQLKLKLKNLEDTLTREAGSVKVRRALEIASKTQETSAQLIDILSSVRIEVMAAEGEFDQYAQSLPRSSFELIRQSMRDASVNVDKARELLRLLREVTE
jgi:pSer/pThr/pTyr-binding forkhead associated (FHA) protein